MAPVVVSRTAVTVRPQTVFVDRARLEVGKLVALDGNEHVWIEQFARRYADLRVRLTRQLERYALALQPRSGPDALPPSLKDRAAWRGFVRCANGVMWCGGGGAVAVGGSDNNDVDSTTLHLTRSRVLMASPRVCLSRTLGE